MYDKKKKTLVLHLLNSKKGIRIMKLSTLFLIIGINLATAASGYSQSMLLTLKMNEKTLREVFNEIEQNSEYIFFYNDKAVNIHRKVSIDVVNQHIENILDQLFRETDNTYRIDDRQVYIARNQQAINQQTKNNYW